MSRSRVDAHDGRMRGRAAAAALAIAAAAAGSGALLLRTPEPAPTPAGLTRRPAERSPAALDSPRVTESAPGPTAEPRGAAARAPAAPLDVLRRVSGRLAEERPLDPAQLGARIQLALDARAALGQRIAAARELARSGSDEAIAALARILSGAEPAALRSAVAEALGDSPHARARELLDAALACADAEVVLGALRGIAARRDPDAADVLEPFLLDARLPVELRAQAATSLGALGTERAEQALRAAFSAAEDGELAESILGGLGERPFAQTEGLFRAVLESPDLSVATKRAALEALGGSSPDAAALLLDAASHAPEAELRAAAAASLAMLDDSGAAAAELLPRIAAEPSPEVRAQIYDTLAFHGSDLASDAAAVALLPAILAETSPAARLRGYRLVASLVRAGADARLAGAFERVMLPWLDEQASRGTDRNARALSVDALRLAGTPGSAEALQRLSRSGDPALARAAETALRFASTRSTHQE